MLRTFRGAAGALAALALAGCGTGGMADPEAAGNAEQLFQQKCGGCHELAAAGTRGTIGPSLDAAFAAPREEGFDETSIREVVLGQMRYPIPPMPEPEDPSMFPPGEWTPEEREEAMHAIAAYVADVAADRQAIEQAQAQRGGEGDGDPRALFTANCASCHTLEAAEAAGTIGPSLDDTQLDLDSIAEQIREGGGGMPAFEGQLTDEQIQALAEYVAQG